MGRRTELRWEGFISGTLVGTALTLGTLFGWHQATGQLRLNAFRRAVETSNLEALKQLMSEQLRIAETALGDGHPIPACEWLAGSLLDQLYVHHTAWALYLLRQAEHERFNTLRAGHKWLVLDLSGADLEGYDLRGVDLSQASLAGARLSGADLGGIDLAGSDLAGADLTGASLSSARLFQANLAGARLNQISGTDTDLRESVLAGASLTRVSTLVAARFDRAVLSEANLWRSRFPGARFDRADMTLASAVEADFSEVESMADVTFTGASLSGARIAAERTPRAWLVGCTGLQAGLLASLTRTGGVLDPEEVVGLVDRRVVDGFRAQLEADPEVPATRRRLLLLDMLHDYYQR